MRQTLAGVAQGVTAMDELREAMNRIEMEQQDLRLQMTVVVDLVQQLLAKKSKHDLKSGKSSAEDCTEDVASKPDANSALME